MTTQAISTEAFRLHLPAEPLALVLDSPHSGTEYPQDFHYAIRHDALRDAEDTFVEEIFGEAFRHGASLLAARFPRSYIDCNRSEADIDPSLLDGPWPGPSVQSAKTRLGKGLIWRVLDDGSPIYARRLSVHEVRARIERYYRPYHACLGALMDSLHRQFGSVWHINCHSMPSIPGPFATEKPGALLPDIVIGDLDGASCTPDFRMAVVEFFRDRGLSVGVNDPYKGVEIVRRCGDLRNNRSSLQLEINRALYMDERSRERSGDYREVKALMTDLVARLAAFVREESPLPA